MLKEPIKAGKIDPGTRVKNFDEVILGYTEKDALKEADRCLGCKTSPCSSGCPVGIDIRKFIQEIKQKKYEDAYRTITEKNNFPAICGRVCPAEYQCRKACVLSKKGVPFASREAINIHLLERFSGDYGGNNHLGIIRADNTNISNCKVAVIGAGPSGLCVAGELARNGIDAHIYESLHKPGGVLVYGIPAFRLPMLIVEKEIENLKKLGVKITLNFLAGKTKTLDELFNEGYNAVFLGVGAGVPAFLDIKGEELSNIYSANEFLTRVNLMMSRDFPEYHTPINIGKKIVVIGGGNTAIDSARSALRLQKISGINPSVTILYRRTLLELPARRPEIEHAEEEGIKFKFLVQPVSFDGNSDGFVKGIRLLKCELGEPDSSGRRKPIPIKDSEFTEECDIAIIAVGVNPNQLFIKSTNGINQDKWGNVIIDNETMMTSLKNVYAGGDIVGGEGTVIEAMGMAKKAVRGIIKAMYEKC
ncbi:oxidoreductase [Candidatus Omnitrophus magneticus]|uniref:Oxidoreductase n=1 Tax=Candidatus Omnitrophus magneticus TaxID=1609969 RepID=A0A0F0CNP0_9BACT|nr:oxidoreductase [Candidatus Omnitrophus magneticus]